MVRIFAACALAAVAIADDPQKRLNPSQEYLISNAQSGQARRGFTGEYFDVDTPHFRSQYAEVVWRMLDSVPLPPDLVKRFDGKLMAITGHEVQVLRNSSDGGPPSHVPCYESYNHHYVAFIKGKGADMTLHNPSAADAPPIQNSHGGAHATFAPNGRGLGPSSAGFASQAFSEHNGNEARQTYHGLPAAVGGRQYAVVMESPEVFSFGPMQINTRNPDGSGKRCRGDCPLPRTSNAPPNASWAGILECPCTTRTKKEFGGHYPQSVGVCKAAVDKPDECFSAAAALLGNRSGEPLTNRSISDASKPSGCLILASTGTAGAAASSVAFNSAASAVACGAGGVAHSKGSAAIAASGVSLSLELDGGSGLATINISVADGGGDWYGAGINASHMDGAYAIIVDGSGQVSERKLGLHEPGKQLTQSPGLKIVSQGKGAGLKWIVLQRPLAGATADHASFSADAGALQVIGASGSTPQLSFHKAYGAATLSLVSVSAPTCVCRGGIGKINGYAFDPKCADEPKSDLIKTHNPTCDINLYAGGISCCQDGTVLLDADQQVPPLVDEIFYRWRFYFEEYSPQAHKPTYHLEWQFGHIEYDVPKAPDGTPPELAVHVLTTRFTAHDFMSTGNMLSGMTSGDPQWLFSNASRKVELVMAGFHCHSPACLGGELINADTGETLCRVTPVAGRSEAPMDEDEYLWLPPCQWGDPAKGLLKPPLLSIDTNLLGIKRANATYGHYGVMAIWQARGTWADA